MNNESKIWFADYGKRCRGIVMNADGYIIASGLTKKDAFEIVRLHNQAIADH